LPRKEEINAHTVPRSKKEGLSTLGQTGKGEKKKPGKVVFLNEEEQHLIKKKVGENLAKAEGSRGSQKNCPRCLGATSYHQEGGRKQPLEGEKKDRLLYSMRGTGFQRQGGRGGKLCAL